MLALDGGSTDAQLLFVVNPTSLNDILCSTIVGRKQRKETPNCRASERGAPAYIMVKFGWKERAKLAPLYRRNSGRKGE